MPIGNLIPKGPPAPQRERTDERAEAQREALTPWWDLPLQIIHRLPPSRSFSRPTLLSCKVASAHISQPLHGVANATLWPREG